MERSLDTQRAEYTRRRLVAMPLAGTIAWMVVAVAGVVLEPFAAAMVLFMLVGGMSIFAALSLAVLLLVVPRRPPIPCNRHASIHRPFP